MHKNSFDDNKKNLKCKHKFVTFYFIFYMHIFSNSLDS